jgi:hypothetical protein
MFKPFFKELSELSPLLLTGNISDYKRDKNSSSKPHDEDQKANGKQ